MTMGGLKRKSKIVGAMEADRLRGDWPHREDGEIYSPEASDYSRFGDWQTRLVCVAMAIGTCAFVFVLIWTFQGKL